MGQTELELAAIIEQASAGIARVSLDGMVETANSRFAEILGTTEARLIGAPPATSPTPTTSLRPRPCWPRPSSAARDRSRNAISATTARSSGP
jgi:PAS domain-containing protein